MQPNASHEEAPFFAPQQSMQYASWRDAKMRRAETGKDLLHVHIDEPSAIGSAQVNAIRRACDINNFVLIRFGTPPTDPVPVLTRLGLALGLRRMDKHLCTDDSGFSRLSVRETATDNEYIPYSSRRLNWHTDGYYNPPARRIHAWMLYCAQDAATGGGNTLLDHEIAYIRLRDADPDMAAALTSADALTIPANIEDGGAIVRPAQTGPVFAAYGGHLHMRYSARQRYIEWKPDDQTRAAALYLRQMLESGDEFMVRHRLEPGEMLLSNNVLHCRDAFSDDADNGRVRLLYRGRYFDRVTDT